MAKRLILFTLMALTVVSSWAVRNNFDDDDSYRYDVGGGIGMSGYLGDANNSNMFKHVGLSAQLSFRYMFGIRWAIRTMAQYSTLSGNTAEWTNVLPNNKEYSFSSSDIDLGVRIEYNFFNFGIGSPYKRLKRWTPYLAVGMGGNLALCDGYSAFAPSIPMAFGFKYKVGQRLNLALELSMTKVFGDNVDGKDLQDVNGIHSAFTKNTDWVSAITLSVSFEFSKRCPTCHYVD